MGQPEVPRRKADRAGRHGRFESVAAANARSSRRPCDGVGLRPAEFGPSVRRPRLRDRGLAACSALIVDRANRNRRRPGGSGRCGGARRYPLAEYTADEITIGVADSRLVPYLRQRLEEAGLPVPMAWARPFSAPGRFNCSRRRPIILSRRRFRDLAALARHPAVGGWLLRQPEIRPDWLTALDIYYSDHLPDELPTIGRCAWGNRAATCGRCRERSPDCSLRCGARPDRWPNGRSRFWDC